MDLDNGGGAAGARSRRALAHGAAACSLLLALAALAACGAPCPPGALCTVAGTGEAGFSGDHGPAQDAALYHPVSIAIDAAGRAWVNDWNNLRVRRIETDGTITTVVGVGYEGDAPASMRALEFPLHHAFSLDVDAGGNLFLAGNHSPTVLRVDPRGMVTRLAGGDEPGDLGDGGRAEDARLNAPCGVAVAADGTVYVADTENHRVRAILPNGTMVAVAGTGRDEFTGDGGPALQAGLDSPFRVRLDGRGGILVVDTFNHRVRRVDAAGIITTVAGAGATEALSLPYDVVADGDALYVADTGHHRVVRVGPGGAFEAIAGTGEAGYDGEGLDARASRLNRPQGLALGRDGSLWIADTFNHRVRRVTPSR